MRSLIYLVYGFRFGHFVIFGWVMASNKELKWIYSKKDVENTPSRKNNIDIDKELSYRQQAANLIQDMGQRLSVNQLTINTAIVYMHRFYVYHSFTFSRYAIAPAALFLAAKVEEQPKKLEHVLKICYACLHPDKPHIDTHSDAYLKQAQELVQNELVLLQTLGFDISVDHPHTHVVKCTQLVKASRDLSQMAYFMATNSLHLTTFCLLYKPTVVAAMCIHLSCKWSSYEIPLSSDGKHYWSYMDPSITEPLLDTIVKEFLKILNRCPTRLRKLKNYRPTPKEGGESNECSKEISNSSSTQAAVPPISAPTPSPAVVQKEKKPKMSIEEYKRTHQNLQQPPQPKQESKNGSMKHQAATNLPHSDAHKKSAKTESTEDLLSAINKDLEGRIRSEKLSHNHNSSSQEKVAHQRSATHPNVQVANVKDRPQNHEAQRRHHSDKSSNHDHAKAQYKNLDSKTMAELYKKHPEKLKYLLKQKSQCVHLNDEEKHYYGRLHAKEQERLKRKQAEAHQLQQHKSHKPVKQPQIEASLQASSPQLPASPPLTLKIKIPPKVSSASANKQSTLSSSGSDPSPARPRKRGHGDLAGQGEHVSAKHSRRSEDHKRHHKHSSGNQSNGGSGKHKHHHHHHHSKSKSSKSKSSAFDESTFQKSLSDAIKMTQEHKKVPSIPTVTLKRTHNNEYFTPVQGDFDPTLPVPNQIPDEIFEDDNDSGAFTAANLPRLASYESAQSTPEAGEIKDNSPLHPNVSTLRTQAKSLGKGPGLFSPEAQLQRSISGFGYHSSSENEFSMPLIQKPSVQ